MQRVQGIQRRVVSSSSSSTLSRNGNLVFVNTNNVIQQQQRSIYQQLPSEKKAKSEEAFPWRTFTIPQTYKSLYHKEQFPTADIHVAAYNPLGKAVKPPQPIIFIPGLCTNHRIFDSIARELNYPYGLVTFDLHSRGKSQPIPDIAQGGRLKQHVFDLMRVLKASRQSHSFIVGHGYGGLVGYMAMSLFPQRIGGLILLDSGFPKTVVVQNQQQTENFEIPAHVLAGFQKEIDLLSADAINSENDIRNTLLGSDSSKWYNEIDVNEFAKYTFENRNASGARNAAIADLHALSKELLTIEELFKLRHPLSVVRSDKGFPYEGLASPVLDEKTAKLLQQELNVKDKIVTVKGEDHYSMLFGKQSVPEIARAIESLVSKYDIHHRITTEFDSLKEETPQQRKERLEKIRKEKEEGSSTGGAKKPKQQKEQQQSE